MDLPRVGTILFCVNSATALLYMGMGGISLDEDFCGRNVAKIKDKQRWPNLHLRDGIMMLEENAANGGTLK